MSCITLAFQETMYTSYTNTTNHAPSTDHGKTKVSPTSAITNLPLPSPLSPIPSPCQVLPTPFIRLIRPNSTLVPLASSESQNVPQCIPSVRSHPINLWISIESAGSQCCEEVNVYWSNERERSERRNGSEEPVDKGRRPNLNGPYRFAISSLMSGNA